MRSTLFIALLLAFFLSAEAMLKKSHLRAHEPRSQDSGSTEDESRGNGDREGDEIDQGEPFFLAGIFVNKEGPKKFYAFGGWKDAEGQMEGMNGEGENSEDLNGEEERYAEEFNGEDETPADETNGEDETPVDDTTGEEETPADDTTGDDDNPAENGEVLTSHKLLSRPRGPR